VGGCEDKVIHHIFSPPYHESVHSMNGQAGRRRAGVTLNSQPDTMVSLCLNWRWEGVYNFTTANQN
jgi:hypothetical protein